MLKQIRKSSHHFYPYYQDKALLIQFILLEAISIHRISIPIRQCLASIYLEPIEALEDKLQILLDSSLALIGPLTSEYQSSHVMEGSLTKFKHYCLLFLQQSDFDKRQANLSKYAQQTWICTLHLIEMLNTIQTPLSSIKKAQLLTKIKRALQYFCNYLDKILKNILYGIKPFWENENVFFFLLRKKDLLTEIYGSDFINKMIKTPSKRQHAIRSLIKKYNERGFNHLIPSNLKD